MNELKLTYAPMHPTIQIKGSPYGCSPYRNLPFQQRHLLVKDTTGITKIYKDYPTGKAVKINEVPELIDVKIPGWGHKLTNQYFFPNHVLTNWNSDLRQYTFSSGLELININFVFCDIDFKNVTQKIANNLISKLPAKPCCIVNSGNGYHLYWSLQKHSLLKASSGAEINFLNHTYLYWSDRLRLLQRAIADVLGGDLSVANRPNSLLRVPGSINYKLDKSGRPLITQCTEEAGSILDSYNSPRYTIEELETAFGIKSKQCKSASLFDIGYYEPSPENRPKKYMNNDWDFHFSNYCKYFEIKKPKKAFENYYRYIYGLQKLDYFFELPDDKEYLSHISPNNLPKIRNTFLIKHKTISRIHEHCVKQRKSAVYKISDLFYTASAFERNSSRSKLIYNESEIYPPGTLRNGVWTDFITLKNQNLCLTEIYKLISSKIQKRGINKKDGEEYLKWLIQNRN